MSHHDSGLKLLLNDSLVDINDACKSQAPLVCEALIDALLLCPLDDQKLKRIRLGEAFRRALQTKRRSAPYRLRSVISACNEGTIDDSSLEAKFYNNGGARAVTALAAAAADDNGIMREIESLTDNEHELLMTSVDAIKWHADLEFMVESIKRKPTAITSKKTQLGRPRPSRSTKGKKRDGPGHIIHSRRQRHVLPSQPAEGRPDPGGHDQSIELSGVQTQNSQTGTIHLSTMEEPFSAIAALHVTDQSALAYGHVFDGVTGASSTATGGNYGIDLDGINLGETVTDSYGIDLDSINAF